MRQLPGLFRGRLIGQPHIHDEAEILKQGQAGFSKPVQGGQTDHRLHPVLDQQGKGDQLPGLYLPDKGLEEKGRIIRKRTEINQSPVFQNPAQLAFKALCSKRSQGLSLNTKGGRRFKMIAVLVEMIENAQVGIRDLHEFFQQGALKLLQALRGNHGPGQTARVIPDGELGLDRFGHGIEGAGQGPQIILCPYGISYFQVPGPELPGHSGHLLNRPTDGLSQADCQENHKDTSHKQQ